MVETTSGKIYEASEIITSIEWEDTLNDSCGKLTFNFLGNELNIDNGSIVRFKYNGANIFYGKVFKHSHAKNNIVTATAYDQLRYCKAKDTIVSKGETVTTLVKKMCNYFNLKTGTLDKSGYVLTTAVQDSKTWLDIIYDAIKDTLRYNGKWFALRDEFGSITLRNIANLTTNLVLGTDSYCSDYTYEKSIDDDYYDQIKLAVDNEVTGKRDLYITKDSAAVSKYGLLQYFDVMSFNTTSDASSSGSSTSTASAATEAKKKALAIQMANSLLSLYNGETETLSMDCIGNTAIRAGTSFNAYIKELGIDKRLIVKSATHTFLPDYTMKLEVRI